MWTYQEARLATNVKVITGTGAVDVHKLIEELCALEMKQKIMSAGQIREASPSVLSIGSEETNIIRMPALAGGKGTKDQSTNQKHVLSEIHQNIDTRSVEGIMLQLRPMFGHGKPDFLDIWRAC